MSSYKRQIIGNIHFTWHAQYLMRDSLHALEMSLHMSRDHRLHLFSVAGAVFGAVGG